MRIVTLNDILLHISSHLLYYDGQALRGNVSTSYVKVHQSQGSEGAKQDQPEKVMS